MCGLFLFGKFNLDCASLFFPTLIGDPLDDAGVWYGSMGSSPLHRSSAVVQTFVVGLLAFCGPGLFNALSGQGKAGSSSSAVAALANGCLCCAFAICSFFSGAVFNLFGPSPMFVFGGFSHAVYAMCVYFSADHGWLAPLDGVVLGVGAALFWTAQGALIMAIVVLRSMLSDLSSPSLPCPACHHAHWLPVLRC